MKKLYTTEEIQVMRKRLYERNATAEELVRHELTDEKIDVSRNWSADQAETARVTDLRAAVPAETVQEPVDSEELVIVKPKRRYRSLVLIGSLVLFVIVTISSTAFVYLGGNGIASDNIQVSLKGQSLVGGGESVTVQIDVTNNNRVPLEAATLILQYPSGTRSVGDSPRNLFEDRIDFETIGVGQVKSKTVQIAVFGEENAEKSIGAILEYRASGSNNVFNMKDIEPLAFKISSSPLVLRIDSIEKVAGGQLVDIIISAISNASTPIEDILITAAYPNGFNFERSEPAPVYGQNVWRIDSIRPEETATIKLQGIISGFTDEQFRINFKAGPTNPDNQYAVGATLAEGRADFIIERPFIDIGVMTNGDRNRDVVLSQDQTANISVSINNTLEETVYDMVVEAVPGGNALIPESIKSENGFYDSNKGVVRWEISNNQSFTQVLPGSSRTVNFTVNPGPRKDTASYEITVNVYARRVAERSAQETLIGTTRVEGKYSATVDINSQAGKNTSKFIDRGPVPPEVGKESTYTITLVAEAGANDLVNTVMETALPVYVNWLDAYEAPGTVVYNTVSKNLRWNIGDMKAGERKELTMQVSFTPSVSQVNSSPLLLNQQKIRANDRFTGGLLQESASAVTTELSTEMGFMKDNGKVIR